MSPSLRFLRALFTEERVTGSSELVLWSHRGGSYWARSLEAASAEARRRARQTDVYFTVCLHARSRALGAARARRGRAVALAGCRGSEASAVVMPALWVDLDCRGGRHASKRLPSRREASELLEAAIPFEPSALVWSGGGYHAYWILKEALVLASERDRLEARGLVERVEGALADEASKRGWSLDRTADLARVLRVPGTFNHKGSDRVLCTLERLSAARFNPVDFEVLPRRSRQNERRPSLRGSEAGFQPSELAAVLEGCRWLRHCLTEAKNLPEPEWLAALSIVGRCRDGARDGRELAHWISRPYPRYSPAETDLKTDRALSEAGPWTCRAIARLRGDLCASCQHRGRLRGPIILGRRRYGAGAAGGRADHRLAGRVGERDGR